MIIPYNVAHICFQGWSFDIGFQTGEDYILYSLTEFLHCLYLFVCS